MSGWILAIDQGTTNTKALLVGRDGRTAYRASVQVTIQTPCPSWVEQDAIALWHSVLTVIRECLHWIEEHEHAGRVEGLAISNQRETVVAWGRATGHPFAPAILWQCRRSASICDQLLADGTESMLRQRTGLGIDPLFSASKMQWLLQNVPGIREPAEAGDVCFGTVDSWLLWKLTQGAVHACDVSNASRTQLLSLHTADWDSELLTLFGVPRAALPTVLPSSGFFGHCSGIEGLRGVPIVSAIGDSHAAMAGHSCFAPGTVKATYGTGSSLMSLLPHLPSLDAKSRLTTTIAWRLHDEPVQYALEGNISMSGAALQWVGEFLGLTNAIDDAAALAASVTDTGGVYFVPAMVGLGAPHWDSAARGNLSGLNRTSRAAHLALAATESIAFQIADVFHAMAEEAGCNLPALHADGRATRNNWLMQFQADVLQRPVMRSGQEDLSALGAAWLAGLSLGWWHSPADNYVLGTRTTTFLPGPLASVRAARYPEWQLAIRRARLREVHP
jgi:glycerol kinase